ncbi:MAG: 4-hydroxy-tetrahydrodipicolinate synthase [Deltaproteobacteria bacterium]|nr:4-hydroxy-tetrahydrodipicolinate synthase [Deltaproteobacteria bacterium]
MFRGAITALVTPFRGGRLHEEAYRAHIDWQIREGVTAIVPCGTTGESATLSHEEHERVIDIAVDEARGRVPVLAGTGSNSTEEAVRLTRHAKEAGADGALLITPYYNKPTQEGLYQHYRRVAEAAKFPLVLYNVPGRTGVNLLPDTVARLADLPEVVGLKEATGDLRQVSDVLEKCGDRISVLSGDDFTVLPLLALGGRGVISVLSNVVPADVSEMIRAYEAGDLPKARALHFKTQPLTRALFLETNPIPVKTALALLGRMDPELRLPLVPIQEANAERLKGVLRAYGLLGKGQ